MRSSAPSKSSTACALTRANVGVELKGVRGGVERRRGVSGLTPRDPGGRDAPGRQVLKERRSPRERGRTGTSVRRTHLKSDDAIARRASRDGSDTMTRFSRRLSIAGSRSHGRFVAARTKTSSSDLARPSIWIRSSVLSRRDASWSPPPLAPPPPSRADITASSSSMNTVLGAWCRASSKSTRTSFSLSPRHLLTMDDAAMLKNVVPHSVATAFASIVFPVPGGP
eukprot:24566-Pelagococcus_subviridis.AAC.1